MNRHHPYGGVYDNSANRRGGPPGPGPDRSYHHRGGGAPRGRGFGRGRGGQGGQGGQGAQSGQGGHFGNYDGGVSNAYDQGPPQGDMGLYNNYDTGSQDPFYQNGSGNYGSGMPSAQFNAPTQSDGFAQGYGNYEDGSDGNFDDGGFGMRPQKRTVRRERDDKVHDSIIEERIQRERPCRTLFIRNIKYETNSEDVRRSFEEHGDIKTFFDLIATRGMVFVTFYDIRAAERARDRLQGSEISGRPIDVHYSLPRDDQKQGGDRDKNQQFQGNLIVTLKDSVQAIDDNEVRRKFQQFGDVKSVTPVGDRSDQRYVEFYDIRACDEAFDRLRHQGLQDGTMDVTYAWEESEISGPPTQRREQRFDGGGRDWDDGGGRGFRGRGRGRGRGGGGRGRGSFDDWDRRDDFGRDRDRGRFEDDFRGGGRGGGRGGYGDRFDSRGSLSSGLGSGSGSYNEPANVPPYNQSPPAISQYNQPPPAATQYNHPPPPATQYNPPPPAVTQYNQPPPQPVATQYHQPPPSGTPTGTGDRLEQARKVQQLLAALKQPQNNTAPPPTMQSGPPAPGPPQSTLGMPPPPQHQNPYYAPPPVQQPAAPYPPSGPSSNPYAQVPSQTSTPQPGQIHTGMPGLPPNILALLQQSQGQQGQGNAPQQMQSQYGMPPPPPQSMMSPPPMSSMPPGAPQPGTPNYQQLMAILASQKRS
ncbi:hypothetical protein DEU56DRAFT_319839 [Suillus clintonianus]|uniref:uncharacterized protein n=1 Tax=Suillus clintonianus TaxID=1904413 RepID=UPI001B872637|nr:uncharacterized protein DEU56DRAFT_319839 [Suillus clintonianus]KAG2155699.1 hypothetical protein DEU56DRAFT_319839 [Suillus clintonianus]